MGVIVTLCIFFQCTLAENPLFVEPKQLAIEGREALKIRKSEPSPQRSRRSEVLLTAVSDARCTCRSCFTIYEPLLNVWQYPHLGGTDLESLSAGPTSPYMRGKVGGSGGLPTFAYM